MRRLVVVAVAVALVVPTAWAGKLAGVEMPDQVTVGDSELKLNGMGIRSKLWVKVYVGGLYLTEKTTDATAAVASDQPKRVVMHFLTNKAKKKKMDAAWQEGFEANSPSEYGALKARVTTFMNYFGDMKVDDVIEMTIVPGEGTHVTLNGTKKGTIEGDDFGQALLKVWLGSSPPSEDLKNGLLGK
jgi:hypothetical protein